jgi:hypothetical protein
MLAACASGGGASWPPPDRVNGCWIERSGVNATTMRWHRDPAREDVMLGSKLVYGPSGVTARARYVMERAPTQGWQLCELNSEGASGRCYLIAEGDGGSLEGGRVFIDSYGPRLRIVVIGDGPERNIFAGARDGCD